MIAQTTLWLAVALTAGAAMAALGALAARSMIAMCVRLASAAALAAAAMLSLGYGAAALSLALLGAGLAPVLLMAGVLLSAQVAKPRRRAWVGVGAGVVFVGAIAWASPELLGGVRVGAAAPTASGLWLAALVFASVAGCAALLGYGERGILEPKQDRFE